MNKDSLKKDKLNEKINAFFRKSKLLLTGLISWDKWVASNKFLKVSVWTPIWTISIVSVIVLVNVFFIWNYLIDKKQDEELLKKISTDWNNVLTLKKQIEDLSKLQKWTAPDIGSYEKVIRIIVDSWVSYGQIKPTNESMQIDIKGTPDIIMWLFDKFKTENITFTRTSLSYQMITDSNWSVQNLVSTSLNINPQ